MANIKTTADVAEWLAKKTAEAERHVDQTTAQTPKQMFLPGLEEAMRALPNHINRSSLFAPIARGRRRFHRQQEMVGRADVVVSYTGEQLDEADADLMLQLLFDARKHPLGHAVPFNRAALLRSMGRATGSTQYEWLHRRMKALTEGTIFIEARHKDGTKKYRIGHTKAFHILADISYDADTEIYTYTLDPRWIIMFDNREYSLLDWNKRLQIGTGQDLAKALQRLFATSNDSPQRYGLDWLKGKMQYEGRTRDFKQSLDRAGLELKRLEIITAMKIERSTKGKDQLAVWLSDEHRHSVAL